MSPIAVIDNFTNLRVILYRCISLLVVAECSRTERGSQVAQICFCSFGKYFSNKVFYEYPRSWVFGDKSALF